MKRFVILSLALAAMGAGCWSQEPTTPVVSTPVVEQTQQTPPTPPVGEENPAMMGNTTATQDNPTMKPASTTEAVPPAPVMKPVDEKEVYVTIEMSENGFKPDRVRVKKNTIVQFKNVGQTNMWPASNPHPSHTDYQDFDARRMVKPGETYEFRFKNVGTWGCHDHLSPGLSCRILVEE